MTTLLSNYTTLGIGGPAANFTRVERAQDLRELNDQKLLILGGGSNLVVRDAGWDGVVAQMAIPGIEIEGDLVRVGAGVVWDDFVAQMVADGRVGVECLGGIPGLVGATPMQNVGAYGQEVSDTIAMVHVFDRTTGAFTQIAPEACGFAYRHSHFKGSARYVITGVDFRLSRGADGKVTYAELQKALGGTTAPLARIRETVIALRRGKGMVLDPSDPDTRSAGSFFTNPIVDTAPEGAPQWVQPDGKVKVAAAWLIERAGFTKGLVRGNVGISSKHALALINRGGATATELLALADEIIAGVRARFGIVLVPEPVIV